MRGAVARTTAAIAAMTVFATPHESAGAPYFDLGLSAQLGYVDNVSFAPPSLEESETALILQPRLSVHREGKKLSVDLDYLLTAVAYERNEDHNDVRHLYSLDTVSTLVEDTLFLNAGVKQGHQAANTRALLINQMVLPEERIDWMAASVEPVWRWRFGNAAVGEARYRYARVYYDNDEPDTELTTFAATARGPQFPRNWRWDVKGEYRKADASSSFRNRYRTVDGTLYRLIGAKLSVFATGGYESHDFGGTEQMIEPRETYHEAGFEWHPSPDTWVRAARGDHFYGDSYSADLGHTRGRTSLHGSYNERITTAAGVYSLQELFDESGEPILDPEIFLGVTGETFIRKRGRIVFARKGARIGLNLTAQSEDRDYQIMAAEESVRSGTAALTWNVGARTALRVGYQKKELDLLITDTVEELENWWVGADRKIREQSVLRLTLQNIEYEAAAMEDSYSVNAALLELNVDI